MIQILYTNNVNLNVSNFTCTALNGFTNINLDCSSINTATWTIQIKNGFSSVGFNVLGGGNISIKLSPM